MFGVQTSKNRVLSVPQIDLSVCADRKMVNFYVYLRNITKKLRFYRADMQIKNIKMVFLRVPLSETENKFNTVLCVYAYLCIF
jgi:two-component sensor histidine kinase